MTIWTNSKVRRLQSSPTVELMALAERKKAEGLDIVSLVIGEPDFDTPQKIKDAGIQGINDNFTHYVPSPGIPALRKEIAKKLELENQIIVSPDEVIVAPGGKFAIYLGLAAFLEEGDEVIVFDPSWVSYKPLIELTGATPVSVVLDFEDNYRLTREKLLAHITPKTKMLILNSPNNPTGRVFSTEELEVLVEVISNHDVLAISDEIYDTLFYDNKQNVSLASINAIKDKVITVNGFSKSHAMTGWRLGYVAANRELTREMLKIQSQVVTCAASFVQKAALKAFECHEEVAAMATEYVRRRNYLVPALDAIPGFDCRYPDGAFYVYPRIKYQGMNSMQLSSYILDKSGVLVTPGSVFGGGGEGCVRMSFATSMTNLEKAVERMKAIFI